MKGAFLFVLFQWLLGIALLVGWVMNLVKFCKSDFDAPYKNEIIRGIGIVAAPVGGVVGYLDLGK